MKIGSNSNYYTKSSKTDNMSFQGSVRKLSNEVVYLIHDRKDVLELLLSLKKQTPKDLRTDLLVTKEGIALLPIKGSESAGKTGFFDPDAKIELIKNKINEYVKQFRSTDGRFSK